MVKVQFKKPAGEPGAAWPAILVGLFVAFGGVLFGYDTGTISGISAMPAWLRTFGDTTNAAGEPAISAGSNSLIVSILSAGTFLGALTAAYVADLAGRRMGLLLSTTFVFNFGVILQVAATSRPLFIAGRFFAGFGVGLISVMIPMYQSETAPKWIRGAIVGCYQLAITIGLLLASCVNYATQERQDSGAYRIPLAVQFAWALILMVGLVILPETPRYLIKRDRMDKAARALARLRRLPAEHPAVQAELAEIEANHRYELSLGKAGLVDCFKGTVGKRLLTGCLLQSLQQLTGINFIFYYGTQYFKNANFQQPFIIIVITSVVNVFSTFPGLYLVEKMGRRGLLLMGAIGMCTCQFIVASVGVARPETDLAAQRAAIAFVCIYIFFFASSWGPVAWVVTGEIFPLKVRAKCLSMTTASNWLLNFGIGYATPYLVDEQYANLKSKVFYIWGACCFLCITFTYFMIYETKGLSLEEVDELYGVVSSAPKSRSFVPRVRFTEVERHGDSGRHMSLAEVGDAQERRRSSIAPGQAALATEQYNEKAGITHHNEKAY